MTKPFVTLWFSLWINSTAYCFKTTFIEVPQSLNISRGSNANFFCQLNNGTSIHLFWLVNDEIYVSKANRNRSISVETEHNQQSRLTIAGQPMNNNIEIQCIFHSVLTTNTSCSNETVTCSEKAILRIQDTLLPPLNLNGYSTSRGSTIILSWTEPPSLDLTNIDPDMCFMVTVVNNKTRQSKQSRVSVTEYTHNYVPSNFSNRCQMLEFSVQAVNEAGVSKKAVTRLAFHTEPTLVVEYNAMDRVTLKCSADCNDFISFSWQPALNFQMSFTLSNAKITSVGIYEKSTSASSSDCSLEQGLTLNGNISVTVLCVAITPCHEVVNCTPQVCFSDSVDLNSEGVISNETKTQFGNMKVCTNLTPTFYGIVIGSTTLLIMIIVITLLITVTACMKCACRRHSRNAAAQEMCVREERIYESPAEAIGENTLTEIWSKGQGSLHSVTLPTDPCPAYDIVGV